MSHGIHILPRTEPSIDGINALRGIPTTVISDVLGRTLVANGIHPMNRSPISVCGNAFTIKLHVADNLMIHKALQLVQAGDVMVIDVEGDLGCAVIGEVLMSIAKTRGVLGIVVDGAVRDIDAFEEHGFPCWAKGVNLRGPLKEGPGSINVPISIGGMIVHPGDIILGDSDGVIAVSPSQAIEAARLGHEKVKQEKEMLKTIQAGQYSSPWVDELLTKKGFTL
ncbi:MenG Demethylmenaquinone methyltransferase [Burkholderiaceae bacterium]